MQKLKKFIPSNEDDDSRLVWKGDPITISLPIDQEKRIVFPVNVTVDLKGALNTDQLRILNDDKSIYLTALKAFQNTRIYVSLKDSGEVLLIDLATSDRALSTTQYVDIKPYSSVVKATN